MPLSRASRVGPYEIVGPLGAGGMGEVYRARDTRLDRLVALKLLPTERGSDGDLVRRFQQEARAASALNHPHIVAIYETGEAASTHFIAMELIDGRPLDSWVEHERPELRRILEVLTQIADALAAAHEAGIVHRDIKPANLLVTPQGYAKVLDFGLAKLADLHPDDVTRTAGQSITRPGTLLGTVAYMSPEQAQAKPVDLRSDIFSLGAVLYRAVAGRRPFSGESDIDVLHAIVHDAPPPVVHQPAAREMQWVLDKALSKSAGERYQSMREFAADLKRLRHRLDSGSGAETGPPPQQPRRIWLRYGAAAATGLCAGIVLWLVPLVRRGAEPADGLRAETVLTQLTSYTGTETAGAISPDGKHFAFVSSKGGSPEIWVRQVSSGEPIQVTHNDAVESDLVYAPDGESLYFVTDAEQRPVIWSMASLGGPPRKVLEGGRYPAPSADGKQLAFVRAVRGAEVGPRTDRIEAAFVDGSAPRTVHIALSINRIAWSPDGRWLAESHGGLFDPHNLSIMDPHGQDSRQITHFRTGWIYAQAWLPDSRRIVFSRGEDPFPRGSTADLWMASIDGGSPRRLTLSMNARFVAPSLSAGGARLLATMETYEKEIWRAPLGADPVANGRAATRILDRSWDPLWTQVSRDGTTLLFNSRASGARNLWTLPLEPGGAARQITALAGNAVTHSALSPDGTRVAYSSMQTGNAKIWVVNVDGSGPEQLTQGDGQDFWPSWSPDGKSLAFSSTRGGTAQAWKLNLSDRQPVRLCERGGRLDWSPAGNRIVIWTPAGAEIVDSNTGKTIASIALPGSSWSLPVWSPDGRRLSVIRSDNQTNDSVWIYDAESGLGRLAVQFPPPFHLWFRASWTRDARSVVVDRIETVSHIVMLEGF